MELKINKKPYSILNKRRFVLAAFNLAFISLFLERKIKINNKFIFWNDGIIGSFFSNLKKIPGSDLITKIIYNDTIEKICIIGNISKKSKKFLEKKSKKKIIVHNMPIANLNILKKKLPKIYTKNLYLITLPTPKQEQLALYLSKNYSNHKIICIGGGLEIASGFIKKCPNIMRKMGLEFIWRLKDDTFRRLFRLTYTSIMLTKNILNRKLKKYKLKIVS
tara:strand:+ start:7932 stop:8591 length:660 start_codon:yes stop_codon:yes gene_type:complete